MIAAGLAVVAGIASLSRLNPAVRLPGMAEVTDAVPTNQPERRWRGVDRWELCHWNTAWVPRPITRMGHSQYILWSGESRARSPENHPSACSRSPLPDSTAGVVPNQPNIHVREATAAAAPAETKMRR